MGIEEAGGTRLRLARAGVDDFGAAVETSFTVRASDIENDQNEDFK